jgi:hemoglobin/transferrin/lactoferrin receptor protein
MLNLKKFQAEAYTLFNGKKKLEDYSNSGEDNLQYATVDGMPAWYTLNLRAAYQFNKYVQLQVALENILDRNYRVFASGMSSAGRNLMVTLRGNF